MLVVESIVWPGKVFATHRDSQRDDLDEAYPSTEFALWQGPRADVEAMGDGAREMEIPASFALVRGIDS